MTTPSSPSSSPSSSTCSSASPAALPRRKLPIGIQTFREIREDNCYYVDKTGMAVDLVHTGKAYFLSRPRRFGKSLFLDTLKELFEGNRALFAGLAADSLWDWGKTFPVIRVGLSDGVLRNRAALDQRIEEILTDNERRLGLQSGHGSISGRFSDLLRQAHQATGQRAVVLVDDHDKPMLDNIAQPEVAREMCTGLLNFYSIIKDSDAHLKFVLLAGVSKFSTAGLFSGLNNLINISLDARHGTVCGYTEADVDTVFAPELPGLDRQEISRYYAGYNWEGGDVYNPFDVLQLFRNRTFGPYWCEAESPDFVLKLLLEKGVSMPELECREVGSSTLSNLDFDQIDCDTLLFQTGYLSLKKVDNTRPGYWVYTIGYANQAVRACLNAAFLASLTSPKRL